MNSGKQPSSKSSKMYKYILFYSYFDFLLPVNFYSNFLNPHKIDTTHLEFDESKRVHAMNSKSDPYI